MVYSLDGHEGRHHGFLQARTGLNAVGGVLFRPKSQEGMRMTDVRVRMQVSLIPAESADRRSGLKGDERWFTGLG